MASEAIDDPRAYRDHVMVSGSRYQAMLGMLPEGHHRILDYGCGGGHFAAELASMGHDVMAIDSDSRSIDAAREAWSDIAQRGQLKFTCTNIGHVESAAFDLVVSQQVAEHTHNPGNYLAEINRVLKLGGTLLISVPNTATPRHFLAPVLVKKSLEDNLIHLSAEIGHAYDKTHHHIQAWDPHHFVRLVSSVGFLLKSYRPMEGVPLPWLLRRIGLPTYISLPGRMRNWSYTMGFLFIKTAESTVSSED